MLSLVLCLFISAHVHVTLTQKCKAIYTLSEDSTVLIPIIPLDICLPFVETDGDYGMTTYTCNSEGAPVFRVFYNAVDCDGDDYAESVLSDEYSAECTGKDCSYAVW